MNKYIAAVTIAAFAAFGATTASAVTVAGTTTGTFTGENADGTSILWGLVNYDGANISADGKTLTWPGDRCGIITGCNPVDPASTLTIGDGAFSEDVPLGMGSVDLFTLTWFNASTPASITDNVFRAFANFNVAYTSPSAGGGSESIRFRISNTPNPSGDIIRPSLAASPLDFGGIPLDLGQGLSIIGYDVTVVGGSFQNGRWFNGENSESTLTISAKINVVPLPAAGWMLLAGLGGLAAASRRRKLAS